MKQIIALGGGGFSMEPENPILDQYVLRQASTTTPSICFLPTASGDAEGYISRFYKFFNQQECRPTHLSLFNPPTRDLDSFIMENDIIYVGGGNTKNLLALWRDWGIDKILKKAWKEGKVLAGISAGSLCWFEEGVTDSFGDGLDSLKCLGFLKGSHCPHYDGEKERRPNYHKMVGSREISSGIAADDGVGIHYINDEISNIVTSRKNAKAYRVFMEGRLVEEIMPAKYLGP
ncbi:peptidase E [Geomicrobium halophilum]|uniref:Peptidase E n=1 Tax=Geomicrobium halophilum TaxID=549000 RepID=A0A841PZX5_9BACL|nr:Type 1 glutamine amidotransferase-like domain-containing protein [Geomicrobium halophilum]MBB6450225.1 peptidase E [Geomicrobium halophilum]